MKGLDRFHMAWTRLAPALSLIVLLSACATLRVDVDVYKGPLTNDEDVQLQQIATTVMGAKPMLEDMRDDLQNYWGGGAEDFRDTWKQGRREAGKSYGVPDAFQDRKEYVKECARQINEILTLYDDLPEGDLKVRQMKTLARKTQNLLDETASNPKRALSNDELKDVSQLAEELAAKQTPIPDWAAEQRYRDALGSIKGYADSMRSPDLPVVKNDLSRLYDAISWCAPFEGGRPKEGIKTRIDRFIQAQENYLKKRNAANGTVSEEDENELKSERELLLSSLLHFAEKVRRIADDSVFGSSGRIYFWDQLLGLTGVYTDPYVAQIDRPAFLQSLSNSLIAHINEYKHNETVKKEIERALDRERAARKQGFNIKETPQTSTGTLSNKRETSIKNSADLMDQLITYLQYLQVKELQVSENWRQSNTETTTDTADLKVSVATSGTSGTPTSETTTNKTRVVTEGTGLAEGPYINPRSEEIQKALEKLLEYRAAKVGIRPSLAALRSSSAASTLHGSPETVGWQNLLLRSAERGIPLIGERLANDGLNPLKWPEGTRRRLMAAEIDKQYWQNINNVRVSGAGKSNYVIVKDDIGNWYVKQYSSNPEKIIKAARNLALFNMSTPATGNLLGNLTDSPGLRAGSTPSQQKAAEKSLEGGAPQTKMQALLASKREQFAAATKETLEYADACTLADVSAEESGGLESRVRAAWTLNTELQNAQAGAEKDKKTVGSVLESISKEEYKKAFRMRKNKSGPGIPEVESSAKGDVLLDQQTKRLEALMAAAVDYANLAASGVAAEKSLTGSLEQAVIDARAKLENPNEPDTPAVQAAKSQLDSAIRIQRESEEAYTRAANNCLEAATEDQRKSSDLVRRDAEEARTKAETNTQEKQKQYDAALALQQTERKNALASAEAALAQRRAAIAEAIQTLRAIVRAEVETILEKRQDALDEYETAVELIQEGVAL